MGYPRKYPDGLAEGSAAGNEEAQTGGTRGLPVGPGAGSSGSFGQGGSAGEILSAGGALSPPTGSGGAIATGTLSWPAAYDPNGSPTPADGRHNPGTNCMSSPCHGTRVPFAFGGSVYKSDRTAGTPGVEIGISDGTLTLVAHTATNGNMWHTTGSGAVNWPSAAIAIRSGKGERIKPSGSPRGAACNASGCHDVTRRLIEP